MKKNIISAIVIFFVTFAVLLAVSEVSKKEKGANNIAQSYDLNE